jgi:hypothetical protein
MIAVGALQPESTAAVAAVRFATAAGLKLHATSAAATPPTIAR